MNEVRNMGKAKQPVSINGIEFDALISEDATYEAEVPEYPIETGFVVSDTIILRSIILDMVLFLTDSPVTWKDRFGKQTDRVQTVIKQLEELYFSQSLVTIRTTEKTYENMAITGITFSKSLEAGYAREIPIKFKQIRVTTSKTSSIPASYGKGGATGINAGTANTTAVVMPSDSDYMNAGWDDSGSVAYNLARMAGFLE